MELAPTVILQDAWIEKRNLNKTGGTSIQDIPKLDPSVMAPIVTSFGGNTLKETGKSQQKCQYRWGNFSLPSSLNVQDQVVTAGSNHRLNIFSP